MAKSSVAFGQERKFSDQAPAVSGGGGIPTVQFSTGNARALADFSRTLFGLSSQFEDQLDQQAEAEAQKEGAFAGMAGNTEERSYQTIRGRSYNRAMITSFVSTLDTRAMVGAAQIQQKYYDNPVAMEEALNNFFAGMASEVDKVAPGSGAAFRATQTARALTAVEGARDTRFKLTQDEAAARLIEREALVMGQVKQASAGLFSDNPEKSAAASQSLSLTVDDYMATYDAVDTVTGKPLFSEVEKAKARTYIRDKVMSEATLSWFGEQADPVEAYMKLADPNFKFKFAATQLSGVGGKAGVVGGVLSQKGWSPVAVAGILGHIKNESNFNTKVKGDGGQALGLAQWHPDRQAQLRRFAVRTGGDMHSLETQAAFIDYELRNGDAGAREAGRRLQAAQTVDEAVEAFMFFERPAGFSRSNPRGGHNFHGRLKSAREFAAGKQETTTTEVPLRQALSEKAWDALDTEMRQRIGFANSQIDRQKKEEYELMKKEQEAAETEVATRIYAAGSEDPATGNPVKSITSLEVTELARNGIISETKAQAFIKAIETEKPERSDPQVYQELQRRMWNGENVQEEILQASGQLSQTDRNQLLAKNKELREAEGRFSPEEQFHFTQLDKLLTPDTMMAQLDTGRQQRRYDALDEFRRRAMARAETGERLDDIVRDIKGRAFLSMMDMSDANLGALVLPRFSVKPEGVAGRRVDVVASARQLKAALDQKKITQSEYDEQVGLLRQWDDAQRQAEIDAANAARDKGAK